MTGVRVRDDETFERALKRFAKVCEQAGIQKEWKRHNRFEKPSTRRRHSKQASERRRAKRAREKDSNRNRKQPLVTRWP
ncbi:30S ribosomal protein S21 [Patescibacteria group bacterium]